MSRMDTCEVCRFFKPFPDMVGTVQGQCRRRAPVAIDKSWDHSEHGRQVETATEWPVVDSTDWCGDFELRRSR